MLISIMKLNSRIKEKQSVILNLKKKLSLNFSNTKTKLDYNDLINNGRHSKIYNYETSMTIKNILI